MTSPTIPFPLLALAFVILVLILAGVMMLRAAQANKKRASKTIQNRLRVSEFGEWNLVADYDPGPRLAARPGKAPDRPVLTVQLAQSAARIGDHRPLCSISVQNTGSGDLERCLVQMEQFSGKLPDKLPMPLVLRTEGQIVSRDRGRFTLGPEQIKRVPLLFRSAPRTNEMYFFDENGHAYQYPPGLYRAGPISMVLGVYGGRTLGKALVLVGTSDNGKVHSELKIVPDDYKLPAPRA
jgi:hypothetical protein